MVAGGAASGDADGRSLIRPHLRIDHRGSPRNLPGESKGDVRETGERDVWDSYDYQLPCTKAATGEREIHVARSMSPRKVNQKVG